MDKETKRKAELYDKQYGQDDPNKKKNSEYDPRKKELSGFDAFFAIPALIIIEGLMIYFTITEESLPFWFALLLLPMFLLMTKEIRYWIWLIRGK